MNPDMRLTALLVLILTKALRLRKATQEADIRTSKLIKHLREETSFVDLSMDPPELADAVRYIEGYLGKTLHINSRDGRLFVGTFKCVDNENNVILSTSHEYRMPTEKAQKRAESELAAGRGDGRADMTSRFVGLIVIPGKEITKIEVEEPRPRPPQAVLPVRSKES